MTTAPQTDMEPIVQLCVAEFFAGIGLVRAAVERAGFSVVFANDISADKHALYSANFDASHFVLGDVRNLAGSEVPDVALATASFPCTDLSLAGNRAGLAGSASGTFWEFARLLDEMGARRPRAVLVENVIGFATSHGGKDLATAIERLNSLGYRCDLFVLDAKWFVPQSRQRLFIVGSQAELPAVSDFRASAFRPNWLLRFIQAHPQLAMQALPLPPIEKSTAMLSDYVEHIPPHDHRWWNDMQLGCFVASLSQIQSQRLAQLQASQKMSWATAYRRTRKGSVTWEIRTDAVSGCLRPARGGSSKQALVEAQCGTVRVRWMTAREYARLQGAPNFRFDSVRENAVLSGFGDAVCVPVITWIAQVYLRPLLDGTLSCDRSSRSLGLPSRPSQQLLLGF